MKSRALPPGVHLSPLLALILRKGATAAMVLVRAIWALVVITAQRSTSRCGLRGRERGSRRWPHGPPPGPWPSFRWEVQFLCFIVKPGCSRKRSACAQEGGRCHPAWGTPLSHTHLALKKPWSPSFQAAAPWWGRALVPWELVQKRDLAPGGADASSRGHTRPAVPL